MRERVEEEKGRALVGHRLLSIIDGYCLLFLLLIVLSSFVQPLPKKGGSNRGQREGNKQEGRQLIASSKERQPCSALIPPN